MIPHALRFMPAVLCLFAFIFTLTTPQPALSKIILSDDEIESDRPKPKIEPMDHMPKRERVDWEYNLYRMEEPEESILMFEQTTKRYPVPIDESSENLSIITRRRIERMNAHSVAEILKRVPGVFVSDTGGEMSSMSSIGIENSDPRHTRIMLDGVPLNNLSSGNCETNLIPVAVIDRIEILKGPASSVWGSSLGGVINIITRAGGEDLDQPASAVTATYGENGTYDARATFSGKYKDRFGILLNATNQETDGIMPGRGFRKKSLFTKLNYSNGDNTQIYFSNLTGDSRIDEPDSTLWNDDSDIELERIVTNLNLQFKPHEKITTEVSAFQSKNNFELSWYNPDFFIKDNLDGTSNGASAKIHIVMWGLSTTTFGFDYTKNELEQSDYYEEPGYEELVKTKPEYETYALYLNQTYDFYHFMILPGIRIDYNDISKEFISPSLGASINLTDDFVIRLTAARGFAAPPASWISEGFYNIFPNPDLKREEVWSYQAGFETTELWFMSVKSNFFYHKMKDQFIHIPHSGYKYITENGDDIIRQGGELSIATKAFFKFILYANGSYIYTRNKETDESSNANTGNIGFRYNDRQTFRYELNGHFLDFNTNREEYFEKNDIIWDFTLCKTIKYWGKYQIEFIGKIHNIFDGDQFYSGKSSWNYEDKKNPHRWLEAGISMKF